MNNVYNISVKIVVVCKERKREYDIYGLVKSKWDSKLQYILKLLHNTLDAISCLLETRAYYYRINNEKM